MTDNYNHTSNTRALPMNYQHHTHHSRMVSLNASTRPHMKVHLPCLRTLKCPSASGLRPMSMPITSTIAAPPKPSHTQPQMRSFMAENPVSPPYTFSDPTVMSVFPLNSDGNSIHTLLMESYAASNEDPRLTGYGYHQNTNLSHRGMLSPMKRCTAIMTTIPHPHQIPLQVKECLNPLPTLMMPGLRG